MTAVVTAAIPLIEALAPDAIALFKQAVAAVGGPSNAAQLLATEYAAVDAAIDIEEEARIAKETTP